jgi:tetratricopeptide (TPR) repeat protein
MSNDTPQEVLAQVATLLERRRTRQARALLAPALQAYPAHPGLLLQSAWVDYLERDYDAALQGTHEVLAQKPEDAQGRLLLFLLFVAKKRYVEAEPIIIALLRDFPEGAAYYGHYADLMLKTLHFAKARRLAQEGLKYDADDTDSLFALTVCDFIEQKTASSPALQQLIVKQPQSSDTLQLIVVALVQRGDMAEARRIAGQLVAAHPNNAHLVALAHELSIHSHWSMLPLWPLNKWGAKASVAIWVASVIGINALRKVDTNAAVTFAFIMLGYTLYSWVWPPLLKRLMARKDLGEL